MSKKNFLCFRHVDVSTGHGAHYIFALQRTNDGDLPPNSIGFSLVQRKWAKLSLDQEITVRPYQFDRKSDVVVSVTFETDFLLKKT